MMITAFHSVLKIALAALCAVLLTFAAVPDLAAREKDRRKKPALQLRDFRTGMTMGQVKQQLERKKIRSYKTIFPDLLAFSPVRGTQVKLYFACSAKGQVLSRIEQRTSYTAQETAQALSQFKDKLVRRFGMPQLTRESQWDKIDYCWGECGEGALGIRLEAVSMTEKGESRTLFLSLSNAKLAAVCRSRRHAKIDKWLYQWISDVRRFRPGISLEKASQFYQKRYKDVLLIEEEFDDSVDMQIVRNYTASDQEFFAGLDYESFFFEGEGPGRLILKFTGDQAGPESRLNKKLYSALFTTTNFSKKHEFKNVQPKLKKFIQAYGKPAEVMHVKDGVIATWRPGPGLIRVSIHDSGMMTFERSDPTIREVYRDAALRNIEKFNKTRFDDLF
jgi:hypothetical protein